MTQRVPSEPARPPTGSGPLVCGAAGSRRTTTGRGRAGREGAGETAWAGQRGPRS